MALIWLAQPSLRSAQIRHFILLCPSLFWLRFGLSPLSMRGFQQLKFPDQEIRPGGMPVGESLKPGLLIGWSGIFEFFRLRNPGTAMFLSSPEREVMLRGVTSRAD
jgi:hypothetical protein